MGSPEERGQHRGHDGEDIVWEDGDGEHPFLLPFPPPTTTFAAATLVLLLTC